MSYTWPTIVSTSAAGYPSVSSANLFNEQDIMQVATPNQSGNARFFFTGNYPDGYTFGGAPTPIPLAIQENGDMLNAHPNFFGKFGLMATTNALGALTNRGVSTTVAPHQPIHAVTDSIWIPNSANLHFNFPNAYSTPAGGGNNTEIPFIGIKGYLNSNSVVGLAHDWSGGAPAMNILGSDANLGMESGRRTYLSLGDNGNNQSTSLSSLDRNANPARLNTASGDRVFFLWMKKDLTPANDLNAYATWGGSMLISGSVVDAKGGITTAPGFTMGYTGLTITNAQISFAQLNGQLGAPNQTLNSNTSILNWRRSQFDLIRNIMGAPAQFGLASRVKLVDPAITLPLSGAQGTDPAATPVYTTSSNFDLTTINTQDGLIQNSLVVYGIKDRGTKTTQNGATYSNRLGEAGLEPGAPVLAQWWNTGNGTDVAVSAFPNVMKAYSTTWLPSEYVELVHINHNYVSKVEAPGSVTTGVATDAVAKIYVQQGLIAPKGHDLLTGTTGGSLKPVVTPVRQLNINDFRFNRASSSVQVGTRLDIFNGNAVTAATGAPALTAPSYKIADGNATGAGEYRLDGYSNVQLTFQPAVNDLRHPSGYIVTIYEVTYGPHGLAVIPGATANGTFVAPVAEYRMGHIGGIGASQTLNLPPMYVASTNGDYFGSVPAPGTNRYYAIKVRNVWMEGTEGAGTPTSHSFDMGKEPFAVRFPMAYADLVSGVFIARY
ncbi:MAG: hypothetical protein IPL96_12945 [Holophagaceae bacterium]|nr:hypothetical protein [Holophagaceae bacterium]